MVAIILAFSPCLKRISSTGLELVQVHVSSLGLQAIVFALVSFVLLVTT